MLPLISIIIPVYNAEAYLSATIESVLQQTYPNWELLIIDDCSSDNTPELIKKYIKQHQQIRYFKSPFNFGGPAGPRNIGIKEARGSLLAFLDADDIWEKEKLAVQHEMMEKENVDLVASNIRFFGDKIKSWSTKLPTAPTLPQMLRHNKICTSSVLVRKSSDVIFSEAPRFISVEDYHLWVGLLFKGYKIHIIPQTLVNYRITPNSLIHKNEFISTIKAHSVVAELVVEHRFTDWSLIRIYFQSVLNLGKLRIKKWING